MSIDHRSSAPRTGTWVRVNGEWLYTASIERQGMLAYGAASKGRFDAPISFYGSPFWLDRRIVHWS